MMSTLQHELEKHLQALLPDCLQWLERMVGINSFTSNAAGIDALGKLTAECFAPLGFAPEFVKSNVPEQGHHLFLHKAGRAGGRRLMLVTHLDTVFPPEEEKQQDFRWRPQPTEGRIYGPGTVDIKGGTALIWLMLQGLRAIAAEWYDDTEWIIAADAAEEVIGHHFADELTLRYPQGVDAVLVFEGGAYLEQQFHVVTARKGRREYRVEAVGRAAHAGSKHEQGINAITLLSQAITQIAQLTDYSAQLTVNVANIAGGTVLNRVPHEAHAELEMRAYDPALLVQAGQNIEQIAKSVSAAQGELRVSCQGKSPAWPEDARNLALLTHWQKAAAAMNHSIKITRRGGLSDANYLCHLGPTLDGLGPYGDNDHCSERSADSSKVPEWVSPSSFVPKAMLNALAIYHFLAEAS
jgi:glutamate carboxypeptidase